MPEATPVAPVAPTIAASSPKQGAAPTLEKPAAAAPVVSPPAAPPEAEVLAKTKAEIEQSKRELATQQRRLIAEKNKRSVESRELGAKLTRLAELEKRESEAKINPEKYLKGIYGDNYYDTVTNARINGVAPADLVAQELQALEAKVEAKFAAREEAAKKAQADAAETNLKSARAQVRTEASEFLKTSAADHPALEVYGANAAAAIAQRIEQEYFRSELRDESGQLLRQGRAPTVKEAVELMEKEAVELAITLAGKAKYAEQLRAKLSPAQNPVAPTSGARPQTSVANARLDPPQRKTLSNDLTGSTPGRSPAPTDAERRRRAEDVYRQILVARRAQQG